MTDYFSFVGRCSLSKIVHSSYTMLTVRNATIVVFFAGGEDSRLDNNTSENGLADG